MAHVGVKVAIPVASSVMAKAGMPELIGTLRPPTFKVDLSKDVIVLWVPGTSNHSIPDSFKKLIESQFPSVSLALVDYMASWSFSISRPNGVSNLKAMLDYLSEHMKKGQKLLVAGESQGAWVISDVIKGSKYKNMIDKVVLLGHPTTADSHFFNDQKVLEINHPQDVTTIPVNVNKEVLAEKVEDIIHLDLSAVPYLLKVGLSHPNVLLWLGVLGASKVPVLGDALPKFHDYNKDMLLAVLWLAS